MIQFDHQNDYDQSSSSVRVVISTIEHPTYACNICAVQKIKKLSETPGTVPIVAKSCKNDSKNRKIAEKLVQPVTPHHGCFQWGLQWGNS